MVDIQSMNSPKKRKARKVGNCKKENCTGKYALGYENNAPIFTCNVCQDQELTWQKFYNEYLQLFRKKEKWENEQDKVSCILGLFCFKYQERFNTPYIFVPSNINPYSSKECRDVWKLLAAFGGDAIKVRKYLMWLFSAGINKNTTITSFGYVITPALIRKYNLIEVNKNILQRHSKLPEKFLEWCKTNIPVIFGKYTLETMNDLSGIVSVLKAYNLPNDSPEALLITEAQASGLLDASKKLNVK